MDVSGNLQLWAIIVGFLVPIVTAIVIRQGWSSGMQAVANFLVVAVGAIGTEYFKGNLDGSNLDGLIHTFLVAFVASIASYKGLLKPVGLAPRLEAATGGDSVEAQKSRDPKIS